MLQWFATISCSGSFFVLWNTSRPGFSYFHVCVLLCSVAAVCHHDLFWPLLCFVGYKSPSFFLFPCMCVVMLPEIWWDRGRLYCRESAQWLAQRVIQSDLMGMHCPEGVQIHLKTHLCRFDVPVHKLMGRCRQVLWNVGEREGNALSRRCANTLKKHIM